MKRSYSRWLLATLALVCSSPGASLADEPPPPNPPEWLLLRIDAVRVASMRPNGGSWDGEKEKGESGVGCAIVTFAAGTVSRGAGAEAAGSVCRFFTEGDSQQVQKDPKAPDLLIKLVANTQTIYRTYIAQDMYSHMFLYSLALPVAAIPRGGLQIIIEDQDGDDGLSGELIGAVRITREQLLTAALGASPILTLQDGPLEKIELTLEPYTGNVRSAVQAYSATAPLTEIPQLLIHAGDVVEIRALGSYSVANNEQRLGPSGYQDGSRRDYNLPGLAFSKFAHGAAVARIGQRGAHANLAVNDCVLMTSPFAGTLDVGVNDRDRSNNKGELSFSVAVRPPRLDEWSRAGLLVECATPPVAEVSPPALQPSATLPAISPPPAPQPSAMPPPRSQPLDEARHSGQSGMTLESPQVRESMLVCGAAHQFHGTADLVIEIDAAGQGTLTRVMADRAPVEVVNCLAGIVRNLQFGATRGRRIRHLLQFE